MVNILLNRIKNLEEKLNRVSKENEEVKTELLELFKQCKIPKEKKNGFKKNLLKSLEKIEISKEEESFFDGNILKYKAFLEICKNLHTGYLVFINADYPKEIQKFILGFLVNKISPFFTVDGNIIVGLVDENQYQKLKSIKIITYYNAENAEFNDIDLYKIFFDTDEYTFFMLEKAKKIFKEFRLRPAYKNKHFIEYSLTKDKVIDFEREKLNKQKEKYSFVYEKPYPNLETDLKREVKNLPFVLALLERIDKEMDEIKESKGTINVVNRMLNYIDLHLPESTVSKEVRFLRSKLIERERL